jgi:cobalt/nickel transport system permease protein
MAAFACAVEIGISGTIAFEAILPAMLKIHAVIGIAEALLTLVLINAFRKMVPVQEDNL